MITGTSLHYITGFIASALKIDTRAEERQARSVAEQRAKRQEKREKEEEVRSPALPTVRLSQPGQPITKDAMKNEYTEWLKQDQGKRRRKGGIPSTILEEDDSSDGF